MANRLAIPAAFLLALLAVFPARAAPDRDLRTVVSAARRGMKSLGLTEKDLHTRFDVLAADAWRLPRLDAYLAKPLTVPEGAWKEFGPWLDGTDGVEAALERAGATLGYKAPGKVSWPGGLVEEVLGLSKARLEKELAALPRRARTYLLRLLPAVAFAVREREAAFEKLTESEWVYLRQYGSQLNTGMPVSTRAPLLRSHHARIDIERIYRASLAVAAVLDDLSELRGSFAEEKARPEFHLVIETPAGRVELGGFGADRYEENCLLTFDLGGNDFYSKSAGGTLYTPKKVSLSIDLDGDDIYRTTVGLAQGSGMYGIGMLVDCAGDDLYESKNVSQGSGHVGVGVLWDHAGDDRYTAKMVSQGTGFQGIGLLRDDGGRDVYRVGIMGQGFGATEGFGILVDRAGNDSYRAGGLTPDVPRERDRFLSMAQGFGQGIRADVENLNASGGIGLLADASGDDHYEADVFGQGCAYWYAIGVLLDGAGRDFYEVHNYGQGAGIHMAVGVLMDLAGDDRYAGAGHALGHALDRGFGFLADFGGDDLYESADGESQGGAVKPYAVGMFADLAGDDTYRGGGNGYVRVPGETYEGQWPKAFFLDLGGRDTYRTEADAAEGKEWTKNRYGWGRDGE